MHIRIIMCAYLRALKKIDYAYLNKSQIGMVNGIQEPHQQGLGMGTEVM